jgi:hypothetical protein
MLALGSGMGDQLIVALAKDEKLIPYLMEFFTDAGDQVSGLLQDQATNWGLIFGQSIPEGATVGLENGMYVLRAKTGEVIDLVSATNAEAQVAAGNAATAQAGIDSASETLGEGETTVGDAAGGVVDAMLTPYEELSPEAKAQAAAMLESVNSAIYAGTPEATAAIEAAANAVLGKASSILNGPAGTAIGSSFLIGIMTGAISIQSALTATLQGIGNMGRSAFASIMSTGAGYSIGQSMIQAVISGAGSMAGALSSRMYSLASSAVSAFKSAIRMASPPKAFTEIGEAIPDAVGLGAEGNRDAAINPIAELAQDLQRAFAVSLDDASVTHNAHTMNVSGGQSSGGGSGFVFHFHGDMTVRDDADIERISRQIYDDIQDVIRGGGALA